MLTRIELSKFRGFAELAADIRPVTVVLGPNSSGKTTLLHAVRVTLQLLEQSLRWGPPRRREDAEGDGWIAVASNAVIQDHTELLPLTDRQALFFNRTVGESPLEIKLLFSVGDPIEEVLLRIWWGNNDQLKLELWLRAPRAVAEVAELPPKSKYVPERLRQFLADHSPREVFIPSFYGVVREEEIRARAVVDRLLGTGDQSHIVRNLVARLDNDAFERLNRFLMETMGAKIVERTLPVEADRLLSLEVCFRDDNGNLELSSAGAGLINLIALHSALERHGGEERKRQLIYLLDEPEAHLHPRLQGEMAHLVSTLVVKQFDAQVIMATHAVEIINRLAMRDDAVLLRVDRSSPNATVLRGQPEIVAELEAWADMTPFSAINFLASRRVIFHEGKTDARIIRRCAELRFRTALRSKDRFDAWTFAELEGSGNSGMGKILLNLVHRVAPSMTTSTEPLRVLTVLDRDHHRQPGLSEPETKGTTTARTLVWNRHSVESLFLTPSILAAWLRAWLGERTPPDIERRVEDALEQADRDEDLNREAQGQLQVALLRHGSRGESEINRAFREADRMVREDPATWQRGKDRARFVLGKLRDGMGHEIGRQMTTDLAALLERVDLSRFGTVEAPIPAEIRGLLDWMTAD
jgi:predicted ATPase